MVGFCERPPLPPNYVQLLADSAACWSVDQVALSLWLRHCAHETNFSHSPNGVMQTMQSIKQCSFIVWYETCNIPTDNNGIRDSSPAKSINMLAVLTKDSRNVYQISINRT